MNSALTVLSVVHFAATSLGGWVGTGISWLTRRPALPPLQDTVDGLTSVRQAVCDREQQMQTKMNEHRERAKKYAEMGQMREARLQIRLRLLYDSQIQNTQKTMTAIESHLCALQAAELNRSVICALHESSRALGRRGYDDDQVDSMLERLDEQHEQTRDILDLITAPTLDAASLDDSDIDAELQSLLPPSKPSMAAADKNVHTASSSSNHVTTPVRIADFPVVPSSPVMPKAVTS